MIRVSVNVTAFLSSQGARVPFTMQVQEETAFRFHEKDREQTGLFQVVDIPQLQYAFPIHFLQSLADAAPVVG